MATRFEHVDADFPSLSECVSRLRTASSRNRQLFRGESTDRYVATKPMLVRVREEERLPPKCRGVIDECVRWLHRELQQFLNLESGLALGFLQHYEVPTQLIDVTADIEVAAYFASFGDAGAAGLIATVPFELGPTVQIQDLTEHPAANRPRRQRAFTLYSDRFDDLKSTGARELGVRWYRFILQESDKQAFRHRADLLDAHNDEVAGVIQLLMDDYGKMNDWSARWFADHIVAAPFITRAVGRDDADHLVVELTSAEAAGLEYDEEVERINNYRIWSNVYSDVRGRGGFENLRLARP